MVAKEKCGCCELCGDVMDRNTLASVDLDLDIVEWQAELRGLLAVTVSEDGGHAAPFWASWCKGMASQSHLVWCGSSTIHSCIAGQTSS